MKQYSDSYWLLKTVINVLDAEISVLQTINCFIVYCKKLRPAIVAGLTGY